MRVVFVCGCDVMCIGKDFEMQTYITIVCHCSFGLKGIYLGDRIFLFDYLNDSETLMFSVMLLDRKEN